MPLQNFANENRYFVQDFYIPISSAGGFNAEISKLKPIQNTLANYSTMNFKGKKLFQKL